MPTLNDILTANGDYTPVSGYPVDDKYENDSPVINVYDRTIGEIVGDTSTSGENVSQYLTFRIPRHPDHYDLIENGTNIRILYRLEDDTGEDVVPVNVVANEDYIIFGWKIPLVVTVNPGVVTFIIHAYKSENNLITYHYKTLPKTYRILETMETDVVVPEIEMYNLAEAYARGTITDVFGHTRPVEEGEPGYHDNSKYYKELAGTSKTNAETAKNAAEVAQKAAETAQHAAENARDQAVAIVGGEYVSYGQTQSLNDTQKNKARENIGATEPNGHYPNMTVGLSENFVGTGEPISRVFDYDTAGGSADISDGNAEIEKMYGDTVAWNQWCSPRDGATDSGVTFSLSTEGVITLSGTATAVSIGLMDAVNHVDGHKYLFRLETIANPNDLEFTVGAGSGQPWIPNAGIVGTHDKIYTSTYSTVIAIYYVEGLNLDGVKLRFVLHDLTQMFGSIIADDIYSLEQSQAGAGVAWFKKLFPLDYYPYDEGTLLNVNPAGIKTVGFNAYDKATGEAELIGGNQYQITGTYTSLFYSTGEVLTPDSTGCFTPTKTGELTVTGGGENTCVHLTWSGYRNGDYEDYWTRTRDINIQPYFPDGLKRAGTVYDEISKDKAIKRIGVVDLGTLTWTYQSTRLFSATLSDIILTTSHEPHIIHPIYEYALLDGNGNDPDMKIFQYQKTIYITNYAYTDATAFKSAMSGVMLYYELDTPIETQIDPPLNLLYQVSDFGTERFFGAGAKEPKTLPIIADIVYNVNYRDTIKNLPKNYAQVRGYYPDLYTGLADNLIDRKGNGTPQEVSYRTSCGDDSIADDGNGIIQSIFGNTVVWNQLVDKSKNIKTQTLSGVEFTNNDDGTITINGTASEEIFIIINQPRVLGNHKHLFVGIDGGSNSTYYVQADYFSYIYSGAKVATPESSGLISVRIGVRKDVVLNNVVFKPQLFDLTKMFGAGNEPSTLDDPRIKWIKDYANEYPEYNIGELISYNGSGIKTVGFNQWDEEWEVGDINATTGANASGNYLRSKNYIYIFPNTRYYVKIPVGAYLYYYDANKNYLGHSASLVANAIFDTIDGASFMRFVASSTYGTTYNHDICINLSWSGYRNGEYEPYWSRTLNLPISTYFPDGMKSAGSVRDELTKDKAVKRIGVVDLGTLEWTSSSLTAFVSSIDIGQTAGDNNTIFNAICSNGVPSISSNLISNGTVGFSLGLNKNKEIFYRDGKTYATVDEFKQAMSGVMLYYELAEPIETTITPPLDLTYKVADFGTEESIADGKSTPFIGIIKYSDDFTRGLVNMPKNYDTTASLDALAASLSTMLTSALDGTVTITRGAYDPATKKYEWSCQFTKNQVN